MLKQSWLARKEERNVVNPDVSCWLWEPSLQHKLQSKCCVSKQFLDLAKLTFSIYQFRSHLLAKWVKLNPSAKTKLINKKTREKYRKSWCFILAPRAKPAACVSISTYKLQSKCCVNKQFLNLAKLAFSIYHVQSYLLHPLT